MTCTLQVTRFTAWRAGHMNTAKPFARSACAIANSLDILGDKWSLLVVRDLLHGKRTYGELALSPERIPTNILADRLERLVRCRHRHPHSLPTASGALRLHAYPEGQRTGRRVARVCALGQTAHTGYGRIEARVPAGGEVAASATNSRRGRTKRAG